MWDIAVVGFAKLNKSIFNILYLSRSFFLNNLLFFNDFDRSRIL